MTVSKSAVGVDVCLGPTPTVTPRPTGEDLLADAELNHVVCCEDENVALCGIDASDIEFGGDGLPCVVCDDLEQTSFCPKGKRCPL